MPPMFDMEPGVITQLAPDLRRILAPNPSALTGPGTNSYILGKGKVAVIDPGPDLEPHFQALLQAVEGEVVEAVIITHSHVDHSAMARRFASAVKAPILAFGDAMAGQNPHLASLGDVGGGEGNDLSFSPDRCVTDGEIIEGTGWRLEVIHTPGHLGNHICLGWEDALMSGDQVMGWATSVVSPPEGDMTAYMTSLDRLSRYGAKRLYPGHGPEILDGPARISELTLHRRGRESQILSALSQESGTAFELAKRIYEGLSPTLLPAAARNVLSHLLDLEVRGLARLQSGSRIKGIWAST